MMRVHQLSASRAGRVSYFLLITLGEVIYQGTAHTLSAQSQGSGSQQPQTLPAACQNLDKSSQRALKLLKVVTDHATAEAYNELGVVFAEENKLNCAEAAFEGALRLDSQDWRARYNLALALIKEGEETKAADQLRALNRQKPDSAAAHNTLGSILQRQGKLEEAVQEFKTALASDSGFAAAALNLAEVLIAQKRYTAAVACLQDALKLSPPPALLAQLQTTLAVAYAKNGDSDLAIGALEQVIKSHPDAADAYFNLATVYAMRGPALGYQKAISNFQQALQIDPHYDDARYSLAKVLVQLGQFSDAVPYLSDYVGHQPHEAEGYHLLGSAYTGLSQLPLAVAALERARQLKPDDHEIRYDLAVALAKTGKATEAIEQFEAAEKINPYSADTHYQLALELRKLGDTIRAKQEMQLFQGLKNQENAKSTAGNLNNEGNQLLEEGKAHEAAQAYRQAVQLDPNNARWHYNLSLALAKLGDQKGQKKALLAALQIDPNVAASHNDLGLIYLSEGSLSEAEREFRTALEIDPRFAEAQNNLGVVVSHQGKDSDALALFRQSVGNDPTFTRAFVNWSLVKARQGDFPAAQQQIQQALKISPDDVGALTTLGMIEGKMGHHQESIQAFRKVISLSPDSADGHLNLGIALADQFDLHGALQEFTESIRLDPDHASAYYNKGRVLYDLNRRQEAIPFLETACRLQPDYPAALYLLAVALGASPRVRDVLERLVAIDPQNADAHYLLGQELLRVGRTQDAIAHWKTAVKLDPQNSSSLYKLARTLANANDPQAKEYMDRYEALQSVRQMSDKVQTLNNSALQAADAHNWPQAVEQLQQAIQLCGQCKQLPVLHRNLGLIYARKGDIEHAKGELGLALKTDPPDADAAEALNILNHLQAPVSGSN